MDYAREQYRKKKREKTQGSNQITKELSIRVRSTLLLHNLALRCLKGATWMLAQGNISDHDLSIKLRRVTEFFAAGHAVRLILVPTHVQVSKNPNRLAEIQEYILQDYLHEKYKNFTEIKPAPGSLRREMVLYPKIQKRK
jgi:translation initiation factor IF-3